MNSLDKLRKMIDEHIGTMGNAIPVITKLWMERADEIDKEFSDYVKKTEADMANSHYAAEAAGYRLQRAEAALLQKTRDYDWMMAQHDVWKLVAFEEARRKDNFKAEVEKLKAESEKYFMEAGMYKVRANEAEAEVKRLATEWDLQHNLYEHWRVRAEKAEAEAVRLKEDLGTARLAAGKRKCAEECARCHWAGECG